MAQHSKTYESVAKKIDKDNLYTPLQAVGLAKESGSKKYDSTVDVSMRLGVDPRKADQMVRGTVNLPHGTGKTARVLVFATGANAEAAREAGAEFVGADELGSGFACSLRVGTGGEDQNPCGLACAVRQVDGAAHHLICLAGIDAETHRHVNGRVELLAARFLGKPDGLQRGVEVVLVDLLGDRLICFAVLCHAWFLLSSCGLRASCAPCHNSLG